MAGYVPTNLSLTSNGPLTGPGKVWVYASVDPAGDVDAPGYFTDGVSRGMEVGDVVHVIDTDTGPTLTVHLVTAVSGNAATVGGAI